MTLFEALKFNRKPLELLISLGGKQDDLRFIDLYIKRFGKHCTLGAV